MMTTQYYTATSVDGFIADRNNSLDWLFQFDGGDDDQGGPGYEEFIAEVGALAMGSTTYEWVLDHTDVREKPETWMYAQPTWVFSSRRLPRIDGADVRFVSGEVAPVHAEMAAAAGGKNVWLVGGGELVGQFFDAGLLDEVILTMMPVFLGSGAPLLPRAITTPPMRLVEVKQQGDVSVTLTYAVQRADQDKR